MFVQPSIPATWIIVQSGVPRPQEEDIFFYKTEMCQMEERDS